MLNVSSFYLIEDYNEIVAFLACYAICYLLLLNEVIKMLDLDAGKIADMNYLKKK